VSFYVARVSFIRFMDMSTFGAISHIKRMARATQASWVLLYRIY
jgi:hypothetical protein